MARPSNKEQRRVQIAQGLVSVMAKRGYDGASIGEIARAAGLTQGLVHYHFENKQEILVVALQNLVAQHDADLEERLRSVSENSERQVEAFIDFHLGLGTDAKPDVLAVWILVSGEALRQPEIREEYNRAIATNVQRLLEIIRRGISRRKFRCENADAAASAIVAAIQGYFVLTATARDLIPRGSAAVSVKRMANGLLQSSG
jgi:TetR/AcrR family transcriptional repressor of bet genes